MKADTNRCERPVGDRAYRSARRCERPVGDRAYRVGTVACRPRALTRRFGCHLRCNCPGNQKS